MSRTPLHTMRLVSLQILLFLIFGLLFTAGGFDDILLAITMLYAPLVALLYGVSGLQLYGKDSSNKEDKYNKMNLWLAIGLIMLGFAEIATSLVRVSLDPQQMTLIVALVHLPGLLLWGIGIIQYLRSLNSSLGFIEDNKLWTIVFFVTTLSTLGVIVITAIQFPMIDLVETLVLSPIIVGLSLFVSIASGLVWIFRQGSLAKPLVLIVGTQLLYLVRSLLWLFDDMSIGSSVDGLIAVIAFLLCGGAILLARELGGTDIN